jgi:hypothetical protein
MLQIELEALRLWDNGVGLQRGRPRSLLIGIRRTVHVLKHDGGVVLVCHVVPAVRCVPGNIRQTVWRDRRQRTAYR